MYAGITEAWHNRNPYALQVFEDREFTKFLAFVSPGNQALHTATLALC